MPRVERAQERLAVLDTEPQQDLATELGPLVETRMVAGREELLDAQLRKCWSEGFATFLDTKEVEVRIL